MSKWICQHVKWHEVREPYAGRITDIAIPSHNQVEFILGLEGTVFLRIYGERSRIAIPLILVRSEVPTFLVGKTYTKQVDIEIAAGMKLDDMSGFDCLDAACPKTGQVKRSIQHLCARYGFCSAEPVCY